MTTINNYSVSLGLDAGQYIRESSLSRKETAALKREINSARTPADNYQRSVTRIEKALQAGAIDQKVYNRLLESARAKYHRVSVAASELATKQNLLNTSLDRANTKFMAIGKGMAAATVAMVGTSSLTSAYDSLRERMSEIDTTAKRARGIGVQFNDLQALQLMASEFAGVGGPAMNNMLTRLNRRIGEFSMGLGEARPAFERLGISVDDVINLDPAGQFKVVRDAISELTNETEQTAVAMKIFDAEGRELLPLLKASSSEIGNYSETLKELGLTMDDSAIARIEKLNDLAARNKLAWEGLKNNVLESDAAMGLFAVSIARVGDEMGRVNALLGVAGKLFETPVDHEKFQGMAARKTHQFMLDNGIDPAQFADDYAAAKQKPVEFLGNAGKKLSDFLGGTGSAVLSGFKGAAEQLKDAAAFQFDVYQNQVAVKQRQEAEARNKPEIDMQQLAPAAAAGTQEAYKLITQARNQAEQKAQQQDAERNKQLAEGNRLAKQMLQRLHELVPIEVF